MNAWHGPIVPESVRGRAMRRLLVDCDMSWRQMEASIGPNAMTLAVESLRRASEGDVATVDQGTRCHTRDAVRIA